MGDPVATIPPLETETDKVLAIGLTLEKCESLRGWNMKTRIAPRGRSSVTSRSWAGTASSATSRIRLSSPVTAS